MSDMVSAETAVLKERQWKNGHLHVFVCLSVFIVSDHICTRDLNNKLSMNAMKPSKQNAPADNMIQMHTKKNRCNNLLKHVRM